MSLAVRPWSFMSSESVSESPDSFSAPAKNHLFRVQFHFFSPPLPLGSIGVIFPSARDLLLHSQNICCELTRIVRGASKDSCRTQPLERKALPVPLTHVSQSSSACLIYKTSRIARDLLLNGTSIGWKSRILSLNIPS